MLEPPQPGAFSDEGSYPDLESCLVGFFCVLWGGGQASQPVLSMPGSGACPFIILQQQ